MGQRVRSFPAASSSWSPGDGFREAIGSDGLASGLGSVAIDEIPLRNR
jgi:hypothetical protein